MTQKSAKFYNSAKNLYRNFDVMCTFKVEQKAKYKSDLRITGWCVQWNISRCAVTKGTSSLQETPHPGTTLDTGTKFNSLLICSLCCSLLKTQAQSSIKYAESLSSVLHLIQQVRDS